MKLKQSGLKARSLLVGCMLCISAPPALASEMAGNGAELAKQLMLVDTHIDVPYRLEQSWEDVTGRTEQGQFDFERARQGGLDIPFMSIYTPASSEEDGTAHALANRMIDSVEALAGRRPDRFTVVHNSSEAQAAYQKGLMGLAMGMENGAPIEGKMENVAFFRDRGISYITLAHSKSNHLSDSSFDENRQWDGLSPFGKEVVAEMNRLGIMIDVSHLSDDAFWQVLELSKAPVIASHSSPRHLTPGFERNMSDEMIKAMAEKGGVIQINFGSGFLKPEAIKYRKDFMAARKAFVEKEVEVSGSEPDGETFFKFFSAYMAEKPFPYASLAELVDAFRHVVELVGVEHVGIGSDFDGVGDSLPIGMKDVSYFPALLDAFIELGYSKEDITAIAGGNLMRVWRQVDALAAQATTSR